MKFNSILSTAIIFGLPLGIALNLIFPLLLTGDKAYVGDDSVSLLGFCLVCITCIFMLRTYTQKYNNNVPELPHLVILIPLFSFTIALCFGFGHYINATFIDPEWSQKSLELLQQKWAAGNYSATEVAGQIEWTDTFHNPWKWGFVYVLFFSILYSIAGTLAGLIFYVFHKFSQKTETVDLMLK